MPKAQCSGRACRPLPLESPPPTGSGSTADVVTLARRRMTCRQQVRGGGRQAGRGPDESVGGGSVEAGSTRGIRGRGLRAGMTRVGFHARACARLGGAIHGDHQCAGSRGGGSARGMSAAGKEGHHRRRQVWNGVRPQIAPSMKVPRLLGGRSRQA